MKTKAPYFFNKKIKHEYYVAVAEGSKSFEIRKDDDPEHHFRVGDFIVLKEIGDVAGRETGNWLLAKTIYITDYAQRADYKVLGIRVKLNITASLRQD